jgi:hypothetical protein
MPDYQQGKIYKLWSPSKNIVYYGSTVQSLAQRLTKHKNHHKTHNNNNTKKITAHLVLECEDYKIELVEEFPCNNKQQLEKKEGEYIKNNECINKYVAGRTQAENYQDNKEEKIKAVTEYRKNNIEKIKAYDIERNKSEERKAKMREYDKTRRLKKQEQLIKKDEIK